MNAELETQEIVESTIEAFFENNDFNYANMLVVVDETNLPGRPPQAYWVAKIDTMDGMSWGVTIDERRAFRFKNVAAAERVFNTVKFHIEHDGSDKILGHHVFEFGIIEEY